MQPTEEQRAILNATGRVIRINARAGTGKTTTLRMLSDKHGDKKILYLVFNKKAREEAQSKFPANVNVKTVHSLAWGYTGRDYGQIGDFSPKDLLPYFRSHGNQQILAKIAHDFLVFFLNSSVERMEDAAGAFEATLSEEVRDLFKKRSARIIESSRSLALEWYRKERSCPHDFYLKMFHKTGQFDLALNRYDMILVDEAQDLSGVVIDALGKCAKRIVIVGDTHQQIYGFRYAMDAMRRLPSDEDHDLTLSFRFGKTVADLASLLIREAKGDNGFKIRGNPRKVSSVTPTDIVPRKNCAILSRTNLSLFSNAMALRTKGTKFRFERDIEKVLWLILDVHWLANGETSKIRSEWIRSFETMDALEEYAEKCEDFQLKGTAQVVRRYSKSFPGIIFEMAGIKQDRTQERAPDEVIISTIHASKGQEYERVYIDSDVVDMLSAADKMSKDQLEEEVNVAYVGFTRSINHLYLAPSFLRLFNSKWRNFLCNCKRSAIESKPPATNLPGRKPPAPVAVPGKRFSVPQKHGGSITLGSEPGVGSRSVAGKSSHLRSEEQTPQRRTPIVGDRVKTLNGRGTVVEVQGSEYLIQLDDQPAKLWEKSHGIKFSDK